MPLEGIRGAQPQGHVDRGAEVAGTAARASYVRPTPTAAAPRMVMDDEAPFSFDWARKAAQAVVSHARFMDLVERAKPGTGAIEPAGAAESPGADHRSVVSAYGEFAGEPPAPGHATGRTD